LGSWITNQLEYEVGRNISHAGANAIAVFHKARPKVICFANVGPERGIEAIDTGMVRCIFKYGVG
jgi:hypothetical protein